MQNWKGNEFGDMFSLVLSDALWRISFSFVDRWEIELVKCSLHIPLLNLSQSLITYWQSIGATVEDFVPRFRKSFSHQEFQLYPVHPNYTILDQTKIHDSFRYNQIKIFLTPSNTFPSHSRLLPLSVWIDPSPFSIISINFLLWAETSRLFVHTSKYTNTDVEGYQKELSLIKMGWSAFF